MLRFFKKAQPAELFRGCIRLELLRPVAKQEE